MMDVTDMSIAIITATVSTLVNVRDFLRKTSLKIYGTYIALLSLFYGYRLAVVAHHIVDYSI
jgi:hypothetical protein